MRDQTSKRNCSQFPPAFPFWLMRSLKPRGGQRFHLHWNGLMPVCVSLPQCPTRCNVQDSCHRLQIWSLETLFDSNLSWRQRQELGQRLFLCKILYKNWLTAEVPRCTLACFSEPMTLDRKDLMLWTRQNLPNCRSALVVLCTKSQIQ